MQAMEHANELLDDSVEEEEEEPELATTEPASETGDSAEVDAGDPVKSEAAAASSDDTGVVQPAASSGFDELDFGDDEEGAVPKADAEDEDEEGAVAVTANKAVTKGRKYSVFHLRHFPPQVSAKDLEEAISQVPG